MGNLGQYRENLIFCQYNNFLIEARIQKFFCTCVTHNCDYPKHSTLRFNLIDFQLNTDFPSQFYVFYREVT